MAADQNSTIKTTVVLDATQAQQEIVKLNTAASDSTKSLEERVEAKNRAVELQNKLSKQTVDNLEDEIKALKELGGQEKEIAKLTSKLNSEKIKATKLNESGIKQQSQLKEKLDASKSATVQLDEGFGGLLGKMKLIVTNPIGATLAVISGIMLALKSATERSGQASETWSKIMTKLSGVVNGLLAVLEPVVEFIGEKLLFALESPQKAIQELGDAILKNIENRFRSLLVLGDAVSELFKGNFSEAAKLAGDAAIQALTGVEDGVNKIGEIGAKAAELYSNAATATENLANKERILLKNRQDLEKQQLTSLRLAEEQRQIRDDISRSFEERIAANTKLGQILEEQLARELSIAQINLDIAKQQQQATGDTIENLEAIGDAELKLLEIRERITGQRSEQIVNEQALLKEQKDFAISEAEKAAQKLKDDKAAADEKVKLENEALQKQLAAELEASELRRERKILEGQKTLEIEKQILDQRLALELAALDLSEQEKANIREKYAIENEKLEKESAVAGAKINEIVNDQKVQGAAAAATAITGFATTLFEDNKAAQIASTTVSTITGAAGAFSQSMAAYPAPFGAIVGGIAAASVVASGIKAIADLKSQKPGKRGGGNSSFKAPTASSTPTTTTIGDIGANNAARLGVDPSLGQNATANAANSVMGGSSNQVTFSEGKYTEFQSQVAFKEDKTTIG